MEKRVEELYKQLMAAIQEENQKKAECRPGCLINNRLAAVVPADPAIMELLGWVSQEDTQSSEKNGEIGVAEEAERKKNSK